MIMFTIVLKASVAGLRLLEGIASECTDALQIERIGPVVPVTDRPGIHNERNGGRPQHASVAPVQPVTASNPFVEQYAKAHPGTEGSVIRTEPCSV